MPEFTSDGAAIERLVREARMLRETVHTFILQMRRDHIAWQRDQTLLAARQRLTLDQRERLRRARGATQGPQP
jgi:hypothetical protein